MFLDIWELDAFFFVKGSYRSGIEDHRLLKGGETTYDVTSRKKEETKKMFYETGGNSLKEEQKKHHAPFYEKSKIEIFISSKKRGCNL